MVTSWTITTSRRRFVAFKFYDAATERRSNQICHSATKLVCPDGEDGLVISTEILNKIINVNMLEETMTVESGMTLKQLIDELRRPSPGKRNDGYVKVRTLNVGDEDLDAAKASLGVLGVISQVAAAVVLEEEVGNMDGWALVLAIFRVGESGGVLKLVFTIVEGRGVKMVLRMSYGRWTNLQDDG
uniref:Uncharacterized protein n=1 Tax=Chenopodium quinoa TaxID=63459 RepID=A0A803KUB3_CHEQI